MVFRDDLDQMERKEDALLGWTFHEFMKDPNHDPTLIGTMPMAKASLLVMKAANEFMSQQDIVDEDNAYIITGGSKRGWSSLLSGASTSEKYPKIIAVNPLNSIVPALWRDSHRQRQEYGAYSFVFGPYIDAGVA